jgi:hypothetical protein
MSSVAAARPIKTSVTTLFARLVVLSACQNWSARWHILKPQFTISAARWHIGMPTGPDRMAVALNRHGSLLGENNARARWTTCCTCGSRQSSQRVREVFSRMDLLHSQVHRYTSNLYRTVGRPIRVRSSQCVREVFSRMDLLHSRVHRYTSNLYRTVGRPIRVRSSQCVREVFSRMDSLWPRRKRKILKHFSQEREVLNWKRTNVRIAGFFCARKMSLSGSAVP